MQKQKQPVVWKYLIGVFAVFWIIFALFLASANIPFVIISVALTTILAMSAVVVGLAWAYQKGI
ncbi:MAG: hypothetical protein ABI234_09295 [Ktedonobacteraceae bacterium]